MPRSQHFVHYISRHCEERSDEAIQIVKLKSQQCTNLDCFSLLFTLMQKRERWKIKKSFAKKEKLIIRNSENYIFWICTFFSFLLIAQNKKEKKATKEKEKSCA